MNAAVAGILLLLLVALKGSGEVAPTPPPKPDEKKPDDSGGGSVSPSGVIGALGTLGSAVAGLVAAAGGGGTAAVAATGSTAAGVATAGGTGAGGGTAGGASGAAAGAGAAAGVIGDVAVGVSAGGAGATSVIVGIVIAFIVAERVVHAQENDKDWQGYALGLNPNALALNRFEADVMRKLLVARGQTWSERSERDFRLDRNFPGLKLKSRGYRTIIDTFSTGAVGTRISRVPQVQNVTEWRTVRALTMEFLRLRAMYGYRMIKAWNIVTPPADWGFNQDLLRSVYEASVPGVGNLADVPSAMNGKTVAPRSDPQQDLPPAAELVGDGFNNGWDTSLLTDDLRKVANLAAIVDACAILKWDPRPGFDLDPVFYARAVADALQYGGNTVDGLEVRGEWLWLNPELFPITLPDNFHALGWSGPAFPNTPGTPAFMIRPATIRLGQNGCTIK